jgi:hypothetical protein
MLPGMTQHDDDMIQLKVQICIREIKIQEKL